MYKVTFFLIFFKSSDSALPVSPGKPPSDIKAEFSQPDHFLKKFDEPCQFLKTPGKPAQVKGRNAQLYPLSLRPFKQKAELLYVRCPCFTGKEILSDKLAGNRQIKKWTPLFSTKEIIR
jgi:hypothetical protein